MGDVSEQKRPLRVVVITGMSGAGRRTAAHAMEDHGWYVVDNLPPAMLPKLAEFAVSEGIKKLAVVLDVRSRGDFERLPEVFAATLPLADVPEICFLEADDQTIVRRQESSRRPVPLQGTGRLLEGIQAERRMMSTLRAAADMVVDTSQLNVHQLRELISRAYGGGEEKRLRLTIVSFGFKNGIPLDADMVVDVRFLPNPHWVPELRPQTGLSQAVSEYVLGQDGALDFLDELEALFATVSTGYIQEGKRLVELAIGCTGGKHRSTAMAEAFAARLRVKGVDVAVVHRDLGRE